MKKAGIFLLLIIFNLFVYSQNLRGTWEGFFTSNALGGSPTNIRVHLQYLNESVLSGYSVTFFANKQTTDTITAKLRGTVLKKRVVLYELPLDQQQAETQPGYQVMEMNYAANKKDTVMRGIWYAGHGVGRTAGHVSFTKISND